MHSSSSIELSKSALKHNLKFLKSIIDDSTIFTSVVKSNAYGHGIEDIVPIMEECGVDSFAVFSAAEAIRVKNSLKDNKTIIILGYIPDELIEWVVDHGIECYISDSLRVHKLVMVSEMLNKKAIVHIDLETGMNRTGLNFTDLQKVIAIIHDHREHFHIRGVCTHFAGAESISNYLRIQKQFERFSELVEYLRREEIRPDILHTACSAAALTYRCDF